MTDETKAVAGYDAAGHARIFNLKAGEKLPAGYADRPPPGTHPNAPNERHGAPTPNLDPGNPPSGENPTPPPLPQAKAKGGAKPPPTEAA